MEVQANLPSSGAFIVDHTSLAMFKECPRKYYYGIVLGRRPATAAAPLAFGGAYHHALEILDREKAKGVEHNAAIRAALRAIWSTELPPGDTARTRMTLFRAVVWHAEHFKEDQVETVVLANGKPAVELSFRIELPFQFSHSDIPVIYCGHIDRVVKYQERVFAMEHKSTKSALSSHYWDRYIFSSQISGYVLAAKMSFNLEIGGAIIDATQVGVNFARFGRQVVNRVNAHQQEWLLDLNYWLTQLDLCFTADRWPHNHESCSKYGGCQFRSVCFSNPSVREIVLRDEFVHRPWDPLKVRGEEENA